MQFKECYQNPFIQERADPYITLGPDGFYYFTASYPMKSADDKDGYDRVILRRAKDISELASAEEINYLESGRYNINTPFYLGTGTVLYCWALVCILCRK